MKKHGYKAMRHSYMTEVIYEAKTVPDMKTHMCGSLSKNAFKSNMRKTVSDTKTNIPTAAN